MIETAAESRVERKRADPASAQDARECCPSKGTSAKTSNTTLEEDLGRKKRIYANAGINEYWVINLKTTEIIVFREPSGNDYKTKFTVNEGSITPTAFPNIQIEVKTLLGRS
ncbi:MAG: Uma2 family endonuclease [Crocosphaera sp.]|nr:Uma2 family endonuclease [Crocosphaera sp.]